MKIFKKRTLTAAVLCAVASVGFVMNANAAEKVSKEERLSFALDTIVVEADRETLPGGFLSREGNLGRLGNKDLMDMPFTQTSFSQKNC